jgi:lipid A 4'-phosphatase
MGRAWILGAIAVGAVTGILFAIFPQWDLQIAASFWDPASKKFPLATTWLPNEARKVGDWTVWVILLTAVSAIIVKLVFPRTRMLIRPSIAFFLIFTFVVGPGLVVNGLVKPYWARPRPDFVEQFGGHEHFEEEIACAIVPLSRVKQRRCFGFSRRPAWLPKRLRRSH